MDNLEEIGKFLEMVTLYAITKLTGHRNIGNSYLSIINPYPVTLFFKKSNYTVKRKKN